MFKHTIDEELELKLPEETDAVELYELVHHNRDYLRVWLPWVDNTQGVDDTKAFLMSVRKKWIDGDNVTALIRHRGKLCGTIDLQAIDKLNRKAAIGYWLAESSQGQGIMTRACEAMIAHAFRDLGLNRVELFAAADNQPSRRVPQRLGFTEEGIARGACFLYDRFADLVQYGLTAEDWKNRR